MKLKLFSAAALLLLLVGVAFIGYANSWLNSPSIADSVVFDVPRGASVNSVAVNLQQQGWLAHPKLWSWWARYQKLSGQLKAGEYQLQPGMTPAQLLQLFASGNVILHSLTIVEGSTFAELRAALRQRDDVEQTLAEVSDDDLMDKLGAAGVFPEAQFFPDTYQFAKGTRDVEILRIAYQRMQNELQEAWQTRTADLPLANAYEALILASIVEKETAMRAERPKIAGVFIERLMRGMRLQTDPTVIYGLGEQFDGNLRKADLLRDTPYNTYTRAGLPPTPICLPGAEALRAAVNPDNTGAIYFVATGKGGTHYFSKTLQEHNAAVQRYLQTLRQRGT